MCEIHINIIKQQQKQKPNKNNKKAKRKKRKANKIRNKRQYNKKVARPTGTRTMVVALNYVG